MSIICRKKKKKEIATNHLFELNPCKLKINDTVFPCWANGFVYKKVYHVCQQKYCTISSSFQHIKIKKKPNLFASPSEEFTFLSTVSLKCQRTTLWKWPYTSVIDINSWEFTDNH